MIFGKKKRADKEHCDLWTEAGERVNRNSYCEDGWNVYPRPQMKRAGYCLLQSNWKLNGCKIRMPFPPQSLLSAYGHHVSPRLTYENHFRIPEEFDRGRILLHFGAVDQIAEVWVNGKCAGRHEGGYLPFSFDITELSRKAADNSLVVKVTDTLSKDYPYGKQRKKRGGMWYTPVSGIWQSVWLENVPEQYIEKVVMTPDLEGVDIKLVRSPAEADGGAESFGGFKVQITLENGEVLEKSFDGDAGRLQLAGHICGDGSVYQPALWSPGHPHLYAMRVTAGEDEVETYFALRTVDIRKVDGVNRVCLNGNPIFLHGVLDQGYYSDGIFLPAEPEEYERDILRMKELGFNLLRKHIKVEPEMFYYYCDKHGMLVMQDMVNNGGYSFLRDTALPTIGMKRRSDTGCKNEKRKKIFREHTRETIQQLYSHPCIVAYTIFNEGWGQFDSDSMYEFVRELDSTRVIDSTSGWFWQQKSDLDSEHIYFRVVEPKTGERPLLVSECGGYSRALEGHCYSPGKSYGYGSAESEKELTDMILHMYREMILPGISKGICGCIYTQFSDVEDEVNGLYTYDRKVCKVDPEVMRQLATKLQKELDK